MKATGSGQGASRDAAGDVGPPWNLLYQRLQKALSPAVMKREFGATATRVKHTPCKDQGLFNFYSVRLDNRTASLIDSDGDTTRRLVRLIEPALVDLPEELRSDFALIIYVKEGEQDDAIVRRPVATFIAWMGDNRRRDLVNSINKKSSGQLIPDSGIRHILPEMQQDIFVYTDPPEQVEIPLYPLWMRMAASAAVCVLVCAVVLVMGLSLFSLSSSLLADVAVWIPILAVLLLLFVSQRAKQFRLRS